MHTVYIVSLLSTLRVVATNSQQLPVPVDHLVLPIRRQLDSFYKIYSLSFTAIVGLMEFRISDPAKNVACDV